MNWMREVEKMFKQRVDAMQNESHESEYTLHSGDSDSSDSDITCAQ